MIIEEGKEELTKELQTKFRHSTWYQDIKKGAYLTKQQALERLAENSDIRLVETTKAIPCRPLLEEGKKVSYLTDDKYKYTLSDVEKEYWDLLNRAKTVKEKLTEEY